VSDTRQVMQLWTQNTESLSTHTRRKTPGRQLFVTAPVCLSLGRRRNHVLKVGRDQRVGIQRSSSFLPCNAWAIVALQGQREHAAKLPTRDWSATARHWHSSSPDVIITIRRPTAVFRSRLQFKTLVWSFVTISRVQQKTATCKSWGNQIILVPHP